MLERTPPAPRSRIETLVAQAAGPDFRAPVRIGSLRLENLSKRYGETIALRDATLDFTPGTIHTILGENGSGKSTMLKLLAGVVRPDQGAIFIDGASVRPSAPSDMQARGIGTVFQEVLVAPHRSVVENIFLGYDRLLSRNISRRRRRDVAAAILTAIGTIPVDLDLPAGALPLSARQLVVLARALVRLPSVLLLDEASAALDIADRDLLFAAIEDYARAGNIVIFISHRLDEVKRLSDRVTVLRNGRIVDTIAGDRITTELLLKLMIPQAEIA